MVIITEPQGKVFSNKKCMTRHLKRDFKCIYFSFMHLLLFFFLFIYKLCTLKKLQKAEEIWLSFLTGCGLRGKKGRKELKSVISAPPNRTEKNNDCFQTDLPLSVIGLLSMMPPQTHVTA